MRGFDRECECRHAGVPGVQVCGRAAMVACGRASMVMCGCVGVRICGCGAGWFGCLGRIADYDCQCARVKGTISGGINTQAGP